MILLLLIMQLLEVNKSIFHSGFTHSRQTYVFASHVCVILLNEREICA